MRKQKPALHAGFLDFNGRLFFYIWAYLNLLSK